MYSIFYYPFIYIVCIRPLLSFIRVPPIEFHYYAQIDEMTQRGRKRNVITYTNMTWIDISTMMFVFIIYPIKVNVENI